MSTFDENTINAIRHLDLVQLEGLRDLYEARHDSANAATVREAISRKGTVQTDELWRSGQLFAHKSEPDDTGRRVTTWTGDPAAWMKHFTQGPITVRMDAKNFSGENSPEARAIRAETVHIRLKPGERIQVVKD